MNARAIWPLSARCGNAEGLFDDAARGTGGCRSCEARGLAVCAALPEDGMRRMEAVAVVHRLHAGEVLAREGAPRREVFTVSAGALRRIRLLPDGRRLVAGFLMPGDFIGFTGSTHYRHTIEAIADSELCGFTLADMQALCGEHPELERELFSRACSELDATRDKLMALARLTPMERLAGFLLDMAGRRARQGDDASRIPLPMTRNDIADYLGLTVETVSRSFTRLRQDGLVATPQPNLVVVVDGQGLRKLAESSG